VGELAVRPVGLAPLVEQRQDLLGLVVEQPVHRGPARGPVGQRSAGTAGDPPMRPPLDQLELVAGSAQRPAGLERLVEPGRAARPCWSRVAASTRVGTWPLSPNRLFPR
jgi:hypothetical protein